jgi:hypothetical protein
MDDLKLLDRSDEDLENEIKFMETVSNNINITFGLEKCAKMFLKKGGIWRTLYIGNI